MMKANGRRRDGLLTLGRFPIRESKARFVYMCSSDECSQHLVEYGMVLVMVMVEEKERILLCRFKPKV